MPKKIICMKKLLLFFIFFSSYALLQAQEEVACMPDSIYQDSAAGVYPLPFNNGVGGLAEFPACINDPYELVFTIRLVDSIDINGTLADVSFIKIEPMGAITGLPEGLDYACNPPDCIFPDTAFGCVVVRGTPAPSNAVGDYELVIQGLAQLGPLPLPLTFPSPLLAAGSYAITLKEEGTCEGGTTSVNYLEEQIDLALVPNPVQFQAKIEMTSLVAGDFDLKVFDRNGQEVQQQDVQINVGYNTLQLDVSSLSNGLYLYALSDGQAMIYKKLVVKR